MTAIPEPVARSDVDAAGLDGWVWRDGDVPAIVGGFVASDYTAAASFALEVAVAADRAVHHPDIDLRYPRHARVTLTTHGLGGVSHLDLALAAEINALAADAGVGHESTTPR
ncbi:MAG: 4a-hydroxytetrahydrobiopterin dehydratase [Actinomycetota bacterium]